MFTDLSDKNIWPKAIDVIHIPEIMISDSLTAEIQNMLEKEEGNYAKVNAKTSVVQADRNYVFFSNQWLYLAVLCKKYAEALKPYGDFFDNAIRGNQDILKLLAADKYDGAELVALLPDKTDREYLKKYITADPDFRPGKQLINGNKPPRAIKDIFGSCLLKKIAVPDASSAYLGNLIFYLAKSPELFNKLEMEVKDQIRNMSGIIQLSSIAKDCAKEIFDYIYKVDQFERLKEFFVNTGMSVKIDTEKMDGLLPEGRFLRYVFALPSSTMYAASESGDKTRVFTDREYEFFINDSPVTCRLTTEWKGAELESGADGNFLTALIVVVNHYYKDVLEIKDEVGEYYLFMHKDNFKMVDLPSDFKTDFSRRYITSLLAKPFVILTGNSGTGKTRITKQFAEYLEVDINDEERLNNWLIVPVGADWTDNAKILGFFNPLAENGKGSYEKTEIVKLIERANKNKNIPFFLILDEMNLSHVERYFADFLSHMEIPDSSFNLDGYNGTLEFPDNLFVIGTVNIDETTYMFSPKVLDRANVVEFKPDKDDVLALFTAPVYTGKMCAVKDGTAEAFLKLAKDIRSGKCAIPNTSEGGDVSMERIQEFFAKVYVEIEKHGFEFAYRTVREIRQYIAAAYELVGETEMFNMNQTIDEQLVQKILPKIHGNKKEIGDLLEELEKLCKQDRIKLPLSAKKIEQMKGKLATVQYASFI